MAEFALKVKESEDKKRNKIYNFKDKEGLIKFTEYTSNTNMLSSVFNSNEEINILTDRFLRN